MLEVELLSISSTTISFVIILDKISLRFGIIVTLISGRVFLFAHQYIDEDPFKTRFIWILLAFVISMNRLIFSGSLFGLFLGWDGLGITSFALIVYYQRNESLNAGFVTLITNRIGDAIIICSMVTFAFIGQFSFASISDRACSIVLILCVASLTKRAQYPFRSWLPAAMAAPTPVSALVHSSTLVTAGIYLVIRLCHNIPLEERPTRILLLCRAVTSLLGGWAASCENDIKKIIALSTLSQLGVIIFRLRLGLPILALFHLFTHALFKALLFLAAGHILIVTFGTQDLRLLGGVGLRLPFTVTILNVRRLCLVSAPFLSAFYSKHIILEKMLIRSLNLFGVVLIIFATLLTAKYVFRILKSVTWRKTVMPVIQRFSSLHIVLPITILGLGGIIGGKVFSLVEIQVLESAFTFSSLRRLVNILTILGASLGIISSIKWFKSHTLSTMFFLAPIVSLSRKVLRPISKNLVVLDYGWLEPSFLVKDKIQVMGQRIGSYFAWPLHISLIRVVLAFCFIIIVIFFNF